MNINMHYRVNNAQTLTVTLIGSGHVIQSNRSKSGYSSYINSELSRSRNVLMNELNNDIGYPQPILINDRRSHSISYSDDRKNYMQRNIKKMSEYAPDMVKVKEYGLYKQPQKYNPARILSIKKQQNNLKTSTKISLNKELHVPTSKQKQKQLKKLEAALQLNDRVLEIQQSYSNAHSQRDRSLNTVQTRLHRFTESFILKRSVTDKKRAYEQVFGEDVGTLHYIHKPRRLDMSSSMMSSKKLTRRDFNMTQRSKINEDTTMQFQKYVNKLDSMEKIVDGRITSRQLQQQIHRNVQSEHHTERVTRAQHNQMLKNVRMFAKKDREKKVERSHSKLENLEDLERIDPQFCEEFRLHKQKKIIKMKCDLMLFQNVAITQKPQLRLDTQNSKQYSNNNVINLDSMQIVERPQSFTAREDSAQYYRMTRKQKILDFLNRVIKAKQQGQLFGIKDDLLYIAMYSKPTPYQHEGSYLFFRAIEQCDLNTLKSMISIQPLMLFQIDQEGRTPIIYASQLNHTDICRLFIRHGANLDALSYRNHNALYYALQNNNIHVLFQLLYKGASPWSPRGVNFSAFFGHDSDDRLNPLLKQAKQISIAMKLSKYRSRPLIFMNNQQKLKILYDKLL